MLFIGFAGLKLQKSFHKKIKLSASSLRLQRVQSDVHLMFKVALAFLNTDTKDQEYLFQIFTIFTVINSDLINVM